MQPEGFRAGDVYICESRYAARNKSFKKIKIWAVPPSTLKLVPREVPLPVVRVASMFAKPDQDKLTISYAGSGGFIDKVRGNVRVRTWQYIHFVDLYLSLYDIKIRCITSLVSLTGTFALKRLMFLSTTCNPVLSK